MSSDPFEDLGFSHVFHWNLPTKPKEGNEGASKQLDEVADAPSPPARPVVDIEAEVDPVARVDVTIDDVIWNTIEIEVPTEPTFNFGNPPTVVRPDEAVKPDLPPLEIPDQAYVEPIDPDPILLNNELVSIPADEPLPEWVSAVPKFSIVPPDDQINWSYQVFNSNFRQMLADRYNGFTLPEAPTAKGIELNEKAFRDEADSLVQRGLTNPLRSELDRDLRLAKGRFKALSDVVRSDLGRQFEEVEITNRVADEAMLHDQNRKKQELEFNFAVAVSENAVKNYEAVVQAYQAEVDAYRTLGKEYQAQIERRGLLIQQLAQKTQLSQLLVRYNTQIAEKLESEISVQESMITLFKTQMEVAKKLTRLQLLEIELFRIEIQAFVAETNAQIAEARQKEIEAEVEADKVEAEMATPLREKMLAEISRAEVDLTAAQTRFDSARRVYEALERSTNVDIESFDLDIDVRESLANLQLEGIRRGAVEDENQAEIAAGQREQSHNMDLLDLDADKFRNALKWFYEELKVIRRTHLDSAVVYARDRTAKARIDAAELLAEADIINTLQHTIATT